MLKNLVLCFAGASLAFAAHANPLPSRATSNALIETIARLGLDCGYLKRWESLSLRAMAHSDRERLADDQRPFVLSEIERLNAEMTCGSELLTAWIEAARQGFDYEMLPPYLVVYKTMAELDEPPRVFSATSLRLDRAPVIAAIEVRLKALEASGRPAEGGRPWPEYIEGVTAAATDFAEKIEAEGGDQAAAWIAQAAMIVELWYDESAPS